MSKKDAAVYLRAAELIEAHLVECSCDAVSHVAQGEKWFHADHPKCGPHPLADRYAELFEPDGPHEYIWGDLWAEDKRQCRILALCFAAAMAETGDL